MQKNMLKTDRTYSSKRLMLTVCRNRPLIYSNQIARFIMRACISLKIVKILIKRD